MSFWRISGISTTAPPDQSDPRSTHPATMDFLPFLSGLFGWVYTVCWSLSFYPQPMLNFRRRSTSGTTVDFPLINCLGELYRTIQAFVHLFSSLDYPS